MDAELIETLLHMHESEVLDFKSQQYPFSGASADEKSKLLKDILAFANAWKTSDAYILIGVAETRGGRAIVQGITEHFDDADLQQFVNKKTNEAINFSYITATIDEKLVGIIRIDKNQSRPIYLTANYGELKQEVVYVRRGSSTDRAKPEEIAAMGEAQTTASIATPTIELGIGIRSTRENFGTEIVASPVVFVDSPRQAPKITVAILEQLKESGLFEDLRKSPVFDLARSPLHSLVREPTPQELKQYHQEIALLIPIGFIAKNTSQTVALDVRAEIEIPTRDDLLVVEEKDHPQNRPKQWGSLLGINPDIPAVLAGKDLIISRLPDKWLLEVTFGKIQPHAQVWLHEVFYIGSKTALNVDMRAHVFADNLPQPTEAPMTIHIQPKQEAYDPSKWNAQD